MSEEKDIQEQYNDSDDELATFVDFADLEGLEDIDNMDVFGDLGDIADLGDVPDLSLQDDASTGGPKAEGSAMISEQESAGDLDALQEDMLPDLDALLDNIEEVSDDAGINLDALSGDTQEVSEDDVPNLDALSDNAQELSEDIVPSLDTLSENAEDMSDDTILSLDALSDNKEEAPDDIVPGFDTISDETKGALDDMMLNLDALSDGDTVNKNESEITALEDGLDNNDADITTGSDILGGLDLGFSMDDSGEEEAAPSIEESDGQGIDSMLNGLLDNLDMNGSIEGVSDSADTQEDPLADLLGIDNSTLDSEDGVNDIGNFSQDLLNAEGMLPEETEEKKPGFFKRVFGNIVTDEIAKQEREAAEMAEEAAALKEAEDAKAQEEKEAKQAEKKAEKEAKSAERKKAKEAKKAERAARKEELKAQREEEEAAELEIVGKLNKVGVTIVVIATIAFLVLEIAGTNAFGYISAKNKALDYFEMGKYTEAYREAIGTDMQDKDEEDYNKIKVVMKVQQSLDAYQNYERVKYYPEALDALLKGIKRYDANIGEATELEVEKDMMSCRTQILSILQDEFGLSEQDAYSILALDQNAYTDKVVEVGVNK